MKVLIVSEPGVNGVFRYVEALCHYLIDREVEVHLAYSDRRSCECLFRLVARVEDRGGRTVNLRTANRPERADWSAWRSLRRLALDVRPDVIHSHSSKAGFLARVLSLGGVRAVQVYTPHAYVGMRPEPGRLDWLYNLVEGGLGRLACTAVVSSDETTFAREHLRIPSDRVVNLSNGVDTAKFSPASAEQKRRLRARLNLPAGQPVLGFLGRSSAQKDPVTLYRAFARAAVNRPITLFHVGQGELDPCLDSLLDELGVRARVVRQTYLSAPADFYRVIDGFILPSRYEGFSLAALEALSSDLPLILSRAPGNTDLLAQPLSHVWSAAPGDVDGFARAIADWHDRLQKASAVNHRRIARTRFDLRAVFGSVLQLYRDLLSGRTAAGRPIPPTRRASRRPSISGWPHPHRPR